jgi:hypothetical protein
MKPESKLLRAARVFDIVVDTDLDDDIIGYLKGVAIFAGEMRRLNIAIAEADAERVESDPADDGPEVDLARFFRVFPDGTHESVAKWSRFWDHRREVDACDSSV